MSEKIHRCPLNNAPNNNALNNNALNNVVTLNDAAQIFDALARGIQGCAVGWPPGAIERLAVGLAERYGPIIGEAAIPKLVLLAQRQPAA